MTPRAVFSDPGPVAVGAVMRRVPDSRSGNTVAYGHDPRRNVLYVLFGADPEFSVLYATREVSADQVAAAESADQVSTALKRLHESGNWIRLPRDCSHCDAFRWPIDAAGILDVDEDEIDGDGYCCFVSEVVDVSAADGCGGYIVEGLPDE